MEIEKVLHREFSPFGELIAEKEIELDIEPQGEIPPEVTIKLLKAQLQAQTERSDFIEDCIAEMATQVYGGV